MSLLTLLDDETVKRLLALRRRLEREENALRDKRQRVLLERAAQHGQLIYKPTA